MPETTVGNIPFSQVYGTKHTCFLTGGGTQGDLTTCALLGTRYKKVAIAFKADIVSHSMHKYTGSLVQTAENIFKERSNYRRRISRTFV